MRRLCYQLLAGFFWLLTAEIFIAVLAYIITPGAMNMARIMKMIAQTNCALLVLISLFAVVTIPWLLACRFTRLAMTHQNTDTKPRNN